MTFLEKQKTECSCQQESTKHVQEGSSSKKKNDPRQKQAMLEQRNNIKETLCEYAHIDINVT